MPADATLYLLRHGQTLWNRDGNRYAGSTDIPLTDDGRAQAGRTADALRDVPFDAIYTSALSRARDTGAIVAAGRDLEPIADARLNEMDYGQWEGLTHAEIIRDYPDYYALWHECPSEIRAGVTGETATAVDARVNAFMDEHLLAGSTILVVGHHTSNRVYIVGSIALSLNDYRTFTLDNASTSIMERRDGRVLWQRINQVWTERA